MSCVRCGCVAQTCVVSGYGLLRNYSWYSVPEEIIQRFFSLVGIRPNELTVQCVSVGVVCLSGRTH